MSTVTLTKMIDVKGIQREGSTLSHTPDWLHVLVILTAGFSGQRRDWVVPTGVSVQVRKPVVSPLQKPVARGMVRWKGRYACDKGGRGKILECEREIIA